MGPRRRGGGVRGARVPTLLLLATMALLPAAPGAAALTLRDLEEPTSVVDDVLDVQVTREEAGQPGIVVFLNPPGDSFGLTLVRPNGTSAFERTGSRGMQPLVALEEGPHKVQVRGNGIFQITNRSLDTLGGRPVVLDANETLRGTDAWVVVPSRPWNLRVEGNVTAELRELGGPTREHATPASVSVNQGAAYVLSLRGAEGTPYRVWLESTGAVDPIPGAGATPSADGGGSGEEGSGGDVPGPGAVLAVAALALVGLFLRRARPKK